MSKFALVFVLALWVGSAAGQEPKNIKIGYPASSYNQIHIWIAKDVGIYRNHGLDAEVIFFRGGQLATQAQGKSAKPEQFTDLSLLQQLEKVGFFTEMAKCY